MTDWPAVLWAISETDDTLRDLAHGSFQECLEQGRHLPSSWRYEVRYAGGVPNGLLRELDRRYCRDISGFLRPDFGDRYFPVWRSVNFGDQDIPVRRSVARFTCRDCGDVSITDRVVHNSRHGDELRVGTATRAILADRSARLGEIYAALFGEVDEPN